MKHIFLFSAALLLTALHTDLSAQIRIGGRNINAAKAIQAGSDVVKAITRGSAKRLWIGWTKTIRLPTRRPNTAHG